MRFLLDTNILIPLEDSALPLRENLANFVRLANEHGHPLIYHPASEEDIAEDRDETRRLNTLQRLKQYTRLDHRPVCPWNTPTTKRNDAVDNEILYALSLHAAAALVTEDRGIHDKAKALGLVDKVYTIQTAEDQLLRLHESVSVALPNIEEVPLYQLTPQLSSHFFDSLRLAYERFDTWFESKAEEGRRAWVHWHRPGELGGICIFARQENELIAEGRRLEGAALKLATFKVGDTSRGRKVGELFLKAAFQYATKNRLENIFIHGDEEQHYFLFKLLQEFGFEHVGFHPGSDSGDAVYLKRHPEAPPVDNRPPFEYLKAFFPHFRTDREIGKFVIPIQPGYHDILFPDFVGSAGSQTQLFRTENQAGNAIKMAYLCYANTKQILPGDIVLFYRSADEQAITTFGIVESCETLTDSESIVARVKRRTVYSQEEIDDMAKKPTKVILFRIVCHFRRPPRLAELKANGVLRGAPQSIARLSHENFQTLVSLGG